MVRFMFGKSARAAVLVAALLCFAVALSSCGGSPSVSVDPGSRDDVQSAGVGSTLEVRVMPVDSTGADHAQVTLVSLSVDKSLPPGASVQYTGYEEARNRERGLYVFSPDGTVSDGWHVVNARLNVRNDGDGPVQGNVGSMRLQSFDDAGNLVVAPYTSEPLWFEIAGPDLKGMYNYTILPHSDVEFGISFVIRDDVLASPETFLVVNSDRIGTDTRNIQGFQVEPQ